MEEKNNKMTIDKLAEITQRGFEGLRNELKNEMNEKFHRVDEKFKRIDEKFDRVDEKFNQVLDNQDQALKRLDNLESDNTMDMAVHRRQGDKLENHEERIVVVEEKVLV